MDYPIEDGSQAENPPGDTGEDNMTFCPVCSEANFPAGTLGELDHYKCRDCGIWYTGD